MIRIYTVPNCDYCERAKEILEESNIQFIEYDLKKKENRDARKFYRDLGVKTAPVICGDTWILSEFDEKRLKELLNYDKER